MNKKTIIIFIIIAIISIGIGTYAAIDILVKNNNMKQRDQILNNIDYNKEYSKQVLPRDEIIGEFVGYKNQFVKRTKYIFEYDKAVKCYNEMETENDIFFEPIYSDKEIIKNIKRNGNILSYEWSDEYFEQMGKGCSKSEIKLLLKMLGFKIIETE